MPFYATAKQLASKIPLLTLTALSCLGLSACGSPEVVKVPNKYAISGSISGKWSTDDNLQRLRLALVGVGVPNIFKSESTFPQNVVPNQATQDKTNPIYQFGADIPINVNLVGAYQLVAFVDKNNDATFNFGEPSANNPKLWLIYSSSNGTIGPFKTPKEWPLGGEISIPKINVAAGWNLYDLNKPLSETNPRQVRGDKSFDRYTLVKN